MTALEFIGSLNDTGTGGVVVTLVLVLIVLRILYSLYYPGWNEKVKKRSK